MRQILTARPLCVEFACKLIEIKRNPMRLVGLRRGFNEPRVARDLAHECKLRGIR